MAPRNRNSTERSASSESRYSRVEFARDFPDDDACLEWLKNQLYPDGIFCKNCHKVTSHYRVKARPSYSCQSCGNHVHPTAGTIFHKSSTSLHLWFQAIYLMSSTRCGISAKHLERELGVTYKTAWRMARLIRSLLEGADTAPLAGAVEMDEMYVGGKPRQSDMAKWLAEPTSTKRRQAAQRWSRNSKTTVFGMVERKGRVAAHIVPRRAQAAVMGYITATVDPDSVIYTDDARIYDRLLEDGWEHRTINHSARVYVDGDVHTQTIEGFWSLVKRGISGTHHAVSPKYLQGYLDAYTFRYNHRQDARPMFFAFLAQVARVGAPQPPAGPALGGATPS
jgi:transposase-like protein